MNEPNLGIKFSVLCSVYYKSQPQQVEQAINSIWIEQEVKPSQIVLVVDGEVSPALKRLIHKLEINFPEVFTIVKLKENFGLGTALNFGLRCCKYELVARMDTDDISLPDRFAKQIQYLVKFPDIDVLGGQVEEWDDQFQNLIATKKLPLIHAELEKFSRYRCPLNHPTVMYKKSAILSVGGYPNTRPEDYLLWVKLLQAGYVLENLDSVIVKMRSGNMIADRRGSSVLLPELRLFIDLYKMKHIGLLQLILNCCVRIVLRLSPKALRLFFYKKMR